MSVNYTPKTWTAGSPLLASELNTDVRDFSTGVQGAWTAWSPTLSGFTLGNGTLSSRYIRYGKTVHFRFAFTAGSTSTFGGALVLSLPTSVATDLTSEEAMGSATMLDTSVGTSSRSAGTLVYGGAGSFFVLVSRLSPSTVTDNNPWTWTTGDRLTGVGTYETA